MLLTAHCSLLTAPNSEQITCGVEITTQTAIPTITKDEHGYVAALPRSLSFVVHGCLSVGAYNVCSLGGHIHDQHVVI